MIFHILAILYNKVIFANCVSVVIKSSVCLFLTMTRVLIVSSYVSGIVISGILPIILINTSTVYIIGTLLLPNWLL